MFCKNRQRLNTGNFFCKKLHPRCFTGFWIHLPLSSLETSLFFLLFFPLWINKVQKQSLTDVLKIDVLKNFPIFTGKHLCWSLFVTKLSACKPANLLKRDSKETFGSCFLKLCLKPVRASPWGTKKAFIKLLWLLYW